MLRLALLLLPTAASAQLLLEEPFNTPPPDAGWAAIAQPVGGVADLTLGKLGRGWRVTHPDAGTGLANRSPCFRKGFDGGTGPVTVRYWLNASSFNDEFGMYPVIIQSPANTLAEVRFTGVPSMGFTPILQCADTTGIFRVCAAPAAPLLASSSWHLVELRLEGAGAAQGRCRAAVDGFEFCAQTTNWTGLQPNSAFIGLCALDQAWAGGMTVDELRVASAPQGSRLRINGPDAGTEGDCLRFTIDTIDTFSQQPAPVAVHTALDNVAFMGASAFFANDCSSPSLPPELSPGAPVWEVYARAGRSDISVTATSSDLIPATPFSVHITPAPSDGGATDGGVTDGGATDGGVTDGGVTDGGATDGGATDGGATDGGVTDGGETDAGVADAAVRDDGGTDAGVPDAGSADAGMVSLDAGTLDAGVAMMDGGSTDAGFTTRPVDYDVGCGCTGTPLLQLMAALALLFRRSRR